MDGQTANNNNKQININMKTSTDADVAKDQQRKNEDAKPVTSPPNPIPNETIKGAATNTSE